MDNKQKWSLYCAACGKYNGETVKYYTKEELILMGAMVHPKKCILNLCTVCKKKYGWSE